jgi:hypothetical protein
MLTVKVREGILDRLIDSWVLHRHRNEFIN